MGYARAERRNDGGVLITENGDVIARFDDFGTAAQVAWCVAHDNMRSATKLVHKWASSWRYEVFGAREAKQ